MMGDGEDEREGLVVVGGFDGTLSAVVPGHTASRTCDIIVVPLRADLDYDNVHIQPGAHRPGSRPPSTRREKIPRSR